MVVQAYLVLRSSLCGGKLSPRRSRGAEWGVGRGLVGGGCVYGDARFKHSTTMRQCDVQPRWKDDGRVRLREEKVRAHEYDDLLFLVVNRPATRPVPWFEGFTYASPH